MNSLTSRVARIVAVAIVAVLALSTLTFLGTDEARAETVEATSTGDSIVKVGWMDDVYDWNPLRVTMVADHVVYRLVYSSLFSYDEDIQRPVNDLAMGYTIVVNPDGTMTVTIPITHNAYFRNAANPTDTSWPLTADDVVYTFNLILANPGYTWGFNLEGCMGFTAVDDYTVAVDVAYEKSTIIDDLTDIPILCRYYWSTLSNPFGTISPEDNFGSGPFYFDAMVDGAWYRFNTAPNYHGAEDYPEVRDVDIDGLLYTVFTDMNALTIAMNEGAVDTISLLGDINTFTDVLGVGSTVPVTKMAVQEPGICDVAINAVPECFDTPTYCDGNPVLRDPAVRKAIMMCLDKDYIVNDMLFGLPTMADSVIQPGFWHYTPDNQLPFDPVAARQVLIDAGYGYDSDGDGMLEAGPDSLAVIEGWCAEGTELSGIRCEAPDTDPTYYWVALAWTNWAQDAGIGLMPAMLSEGVMTNIAWYKCDYDIWVWHWGWDPDPIGSALSCWMISEIEEGGDNCQMPMGDWWYNDHNYTDAFEEIGLELDGRWSEYDEVLSQALRTVDTDDRKLLVNHLQQMIYDSYTENPPYYDFGLYAYTDVRFSGWGDWAAHPGLAIRSTMPWLWFNLESDGNAAPYFASALASSYQVIAGDESPFSVVVSDREGDPLTVEWLWGDGTTSVDYLATSTDVPTAVEQSHVYSTIGTFMLTVNLYDLEHVVSCYATVSSLDHLNTAPTILSLEAVTPLPWLANQDIAFSGIAVDSESGGEDG
ncbi:MAG: ABC transporter substrate-binding protein, partial [Thermoplasmata archaeon]|nr:ABC transporter substrate-binding protein [Thermoplasmata archaeon]